MSVILLCCERNSVMLLSPISCNKNVKTKMQIWSCHRKTLYLQKNINRRYNYGRHNDKHREQYDTYVLERIAFDE